MPEPRRFLGDSIPTGSEVIEVQVTDLQQLFHAIDPSPFRERDLDPDAEEFIASWARETPHDIPLALLVSVDRGPGFDDEPAALRDAVHDFFAARAAAARKRLRELLRIGRTSLLVGIAFLVAAVVLSNIVGNAMQGRRSGELLREGLVICGWVAMWRPLEIFLYGWWPIRAQARFYDRLGEMPVRVAYNWSAEPGSWRSAKERQVPGRPRPTRPALVPSS